MANLELAFHRIFAKLQNLNHCQIFHEYGTLYNNSIDLLKLRNTIAKHRILIAYTDNIVIKLYKYPVYSIEYRYVTGFAKIRHNNASIQSYISACIDS